MGMVSSIYKREHHRRIHRVLAAMDPDFLTAAACCFAGGTCLALLLGEYRESVDMDFLCASPAGYRAIRGTVSNLSLGELFMEAPRLLREVRADRYGIRTVLLLDEVPIKFEVVLEGRVELECDRVDAIPVPILHRSSHMLEKLLANSDRHADRSVYARDIIDLMVMIDHWGEIPSLVWERAEAAYGPAARADYNKAVAALCDVPAYLETCFERLQVEPAIRSSIRKRLAVPESPI
jgi:hypothetical protein